MRAWLIPLMLVAVFLTACGEARDGGEALAAAPPALLGEYAAASDAARTLGDVGIERAGLIFASGAVLYTRTLEPRAGADRTSRNGASYAALAGADVAQVELRRVVSASAADGFCEGREPSFVALAHDPGRSRFTLLVFAGDEPPGPNAEAVSLCGRYAYAQVQTAAPGVVLW